MIVQDQSEQKSLHGVEEETTKSAGSNDNDNKTPTKAKAAPLRRKSSSMSECLIEGASNWMYPDNPDIKSFDELLDLSADDRSGIRSDCESVDNSVAYFDHSDFVPSNWNHSLHMIPPVGIAALATGLACLHPLVFVAGALTAFGAVQVVGAGYEWYTGAPPTDAVDSTSWRNIVFCDEDTTSAKAKNIEPPADYSLTNKQIEAETNTEATVETDLDDEEQTQASLKNKSSLVPVDSTSTPEDVAQVPVPSHSLSNATSPISGDNPKRLRDKGDIMAWVNRCYPALANTATKNQQFFGLNTKEFFAVFFADDAPYTFEEFQKQRSDKDIIYGKWHAESMDYKPSMHPEATTVSSNLRAKERTLNFQAKTKSYFGPPYARTTKVQRAFCPSKRLLVIESRTTVTEIPFCDRFFVMERWVITASRNPETKIYESELSVSSEAMFTQSCPFEFKIKSTSSNTIGDIVSSWCAMAHEALKLSEKQRFQRIQNEGSHWDDDESACEDEAENEPIKAEPNEALSEDKHDKKMSPDDVDVIEVQHFRGCKSRVVGEELGEEEHAADGAIASDSPCESAPIEVPIRAKRVSSMKRASRSLSKMIRRRNSAPLQDGATIQQ